MRKGITPIVATVVLLLIAIAIAGAAYTYITGYWGGLTQRTLEVTSAQCTSTGAVLNLRNSGTGNITITDGGADVSVTKRVVAGGAWANKTWTYSPAAAVLTPGAGGSMTDFGCNKANFAGSTCEYTVVAGGRPTTQQVTC